jgi:hypothetical protein
MSLTGLISGLHIGKPTLGGNQYPIVLVEEQAVGLPCVSPRRAGIPEMIPAVLPHPRWRPNVAQKLGVKMVQSLYVRTHV